MRVIVTGASGLIGGELAQCLSAEGHSVTAVARRPIQLPAPIQTLTVENYDLVPDGDWIVHLAEERVIAQVADADAGAAHQTATVARVANLAARFRGRIMYASSAAVYGDSGATPRRVSDAVESRGPYAMTKLRCEEVVRGAGGVNLRFGNILGRRIADDSVVATIVRQLGREGPILVRDTRPVRDYLHVEDAARCCAGLLRVGARGTFNVGSGIGTSVAQLVEELLSITGEVGRSAIANEKVGPESRVILDIGETMEAAQWSPQVTLLRALREIVDAWGKK
jgi:UDP-glucose 4-epimerase